MITTTMSLTRRPECDGQESVTRGHATTEKHVGVCVRVCAWGWNIDESKNETTRRD